MKNYFVLFVFLFWCKNSFAQDYIGKPFSKDTNFTSRTYSKYADFNKAVFLDSMNFNNSEFQKSVNFSNVKFINGVDFSYTTFIYGVHFFNTHFSKFIRFTNAAFLGDVDFSYSEFSEESTLDLSDLTLVDTSFFNFVGTLLPDTILFENNGNIKNEINFVSADFDRSTVSNKNRLSGKPIYIYLLNSNVAKLHLDYFHFKLLFPDSTKNTPFNKQHISNDQKASIYESLLNNFKTNGQTQSYQLLDIEYQEFIWHISSWKRYLIWVPNLWWNFGYNKEYIFGWTAFFLVIFTCFTYFFIYSLNTKIYVIDKIPVNEAWQKKWSFKDFIKRLWFSFMYTSTVFFKLSVDIKNLEFKERRGTFYIIVVYAVGLVCIAYMANFVLQKT